ncbi:MAG TPA: MFS transporter, partial [Verrucomicrobiales bacterium]|nr:MFS transporter [Verrucomicrobiales bacterium]
MSADSASGPKLKLTRTQWLICFIATLGFLFDIYELLMLPLIGKDALGDLAGVRPGTPEFTHWFRIIFFVPAICGGIFGLLGGYLTDLFGRRRVLTYSILLYAVAAFCAGFSTTPYQLLFFRCLVFIGVCVEFVAAVAWLSELFPDRVQREKVLGYTQAFSSVGGLTVAIVYGYLSQIASTGGGLPVMPDWFAGILGPISDGSDTAVWRYTLMSGLIPAIPLIIIRPFLPESPQWQKKKDAGQLKRPSLAALFAPQFKRTTIIITLLFALAYGGAFGALQ